MRKIAFKFKESILILIRSINNCKFFIIVQSKSAKPPYVIVLCFNLEIEALNKNSSRWETTWFNCHILHFKCFKLVAYGLYRRFHVIWVNGPTLEAQEWHFCNFKWQNDIFVNIVARGDGTTRIRYLFHTLAATSSPLSPTYIFVLQSLLGVRWDVPLVFDVFALVFAIFTHSFY